MVENSLGIPGTLPPNDARIAVAGLGIGGFALAFAGQKTIENLFGTVMLIADQPVRVGDFCRVGESLGTIETVGIRSSRIRTLGRTVVSGAERTSCLDGRGKLRSA